MNEPASLTKDELRELLSIAQSLSQQKDLRLQQNDLRLREQDIALQQSKLEIERLTRDRDLYRLAFNQLMRNRFGRHSERYINNPDQLRIDFGDTDEAADAAQGLATAIEDQQQTIPAHSRKRPAKKRDEGLPDHLPRYEVVASMPEDQKTCPHHGEKVVLPESMWDRTETLEFERPKLKVRVTKYPKYACTNEPECGVASPKRPVGIVEGNKYDTSIAAEIITGKYSYHLPLYRLQDYFAGCGWVPARSTQCNILAGSFEIVRPVLEHFNKVLRTDSVVGTDDTTLTLLYPDEMPQLDLSDPRQRRIHEVFTEALAKGKPSITARMWAYRGVSIKLNVFDFTVSRHRDGPELFFGDYEGTLLGDCWSGFQSITVASKGQIVRAACNAHARRKIFDSSAYPDDRRQWLLWYQTLYAIEDRGKVMDPSERQKLRQSEAVPIWNQLEAFLAEADRRTLNVILPKSDLGMALQYVRNHLLQLKAYLTDGRIPIDNNETEQLMKQVAIGRKNWLFAGSVAGGERTAGLMTLTSSAIRNDLDVWDYVKDVLDQLLAGSTDYESLLPWNWASKHPQSIRKYRQLERRDRAERQAATRTSRRQPKHC